MEKPEFDNLRKKESWSLGKFEQKSLKNLEYLTIFTCLVVKFWFDTNNLSYF